MICKNCGGTINVIGVECPNCHVSLKEATKDKYVSGTTSNEDIKSDKLLLISLLVPVYGIYEYIMNRNDYPRKADSYKKGSIFGLIVWAMIIAFIVLLFI